MQNNDDDTFRGNLDFQYLKSNMWKIIIHLLVAQNLLWFSSFKVIEKNSKSWDNRKLQTGLAGIAFYKVWWGFPVAQW